MKKNAQNSDVISKNPSTSEPKSNQNLKQARHKIVHDYSHNPKRKTPRVIYDFSGTVSVTEQHTAQAFDLNYLISKYRPDEITSYLIAKGRSRPPIQGHDFSIEPTYQEALNEVTRLKGIFNGLPHEVQAQFKSPLEFVKFVDDPRNAEKLIQLGLMTKRDLPDPVPAPDPAPAPAPAPAKP